MRARGWLRDLTPFTPIPGGSLPMQALRAVPALYTPVLMRLLGKMKLAEGEDADAFWAELSEIVIGKFQVSGDLDLSQKEACGRLLGTLRGLRPAFKVWNPVLHACVLHLPSLVTSANRSCFFVGCVPQLLLSVASPAQHWWIFSVPLCWHGCTLCTPI